VIDKKDIINFLFLISFPIYGVGTYVSGAISPSIGYFISISTHLLILTFYCIDLLYKREFSLRINCTYAVMLLYVISCVASLFVALYNGLPESNLRLTIGRSLLMIIPFHAFIVVLLYNGNEEHKLVKLTTVSLSLLLAINVIGYFVLGLVNPVHSIEGRFSMPFIESFYSGANLLAIINLILLYYLIRCPAGSFQFVALTGYFVFNFVLFYLINSRLSTLILLLVIGLFLFRVLTVKGLFVGSMFTIPVLLSCGFLIFHILQLPVFSFLVQRVDLQDVVTFNGRAFLWKDAIDWLLYDQRGLFFGNGYKGHYFLDLIPDVVLLWNAVDAHHLHLHSTSLEILVSQGVVSFVVFTFLFYQVYRYYKQRYGERNDEGAFFAVVIFLLFLMQVDGFVYLDAMGFIIFSLLISRTSVRAVVASDVETRRRNPGQVYIMPEDQVMPVPGNNFK
jgi:O-antigen ligase